MNSTMNFSSNADPSNLFLCDSDGQLQNHFFLTLHIVIMLIGIPSNCFSLYVSWQHIRQKNAIGVYLFSLALADILYIMVMPIWVDYIIKDRWVYGQFLCNLSMFMLFTNYYTSSTLLCCISVDRYLAVVHPLKYPVLREVKTAYCVIVTVWLVTIAFNAATIFYYGYYHKSSINGVFCFDIYPMPTEHVKLNTIRLFIGFMLPALLTAFCCLRIHRAVKSNKATEWREQKRISMLLGAVTLTLWLSFGPIHVTLLLRSLLEKDCQTASLLFTPFKISMALSSLNCLADPLLYCFVTKTAKSEMTLAFSLIQRKRKRKTTDKLQAKDQCHP